MTPSTPRTLRRRCTALGAHAHMLRLDPSKGSEGEKESAHVPYAVRPRRTGEVDRWKQKEVALATLVFVVPQKHRCP